MLERLSVHLDNTASVARDHMANERTYLAWLRTSLTFASAGVALTQLLRLHPGGDSFLHAAAPVIGALFVAGGILTLVLGLFRYFHVQSILQTGRFPVSRLEISVSFTISLALVVVALAFIARAVP